MVNYAQLVMGPAGSGKSSYCERIQEHIGARAKVVNLDPAVDGNLRYTAYGDIREMITVHDLMENGEKIIGPNTSVLSSIRYATTHPEWLSNLFEDTEDLYVLFDMPGQMELCTHEQLTNDFISQLYALNFKVCGLFLIESQFVTDACKFVGGLMAALTTMMNLQITSLCVITKMDVASASSSKMLERLSGEDPDEEEMVDDLSQNMPARFRNFARVLVNFMHDNGQLQHRLFDRTSDESVEDLLCEIDFLMNRHEERDIKCADIE